VEQSSRIRRVACPSLGVALAIAGSSLGAAAGPKLPSRTVQCGEVLTESLRIANNLRDCAGDGLVVGAPGLTIDLGGHRIDGVSAAGSVGIDNGAGHDGVEIRGGLVAQFETGVLLENASGNVVTLLRIHDVANDGVHLVASSGNTLSRSLVSGTDIGFRLDSASNGNTLDGNDASANRTDGFYVEDSSGLVFTRNLAAGNGAYGFESFASGNTYRGNVARGNDIDGIIIDGASNDNLLKGNEASANDRSGIEVVGGSGNVLVANRTHENGDHGILADTSALALRKNKADRNGFLGGGPGDDVGLGISVPAGAISSGNKANGNDDPNECEASDLSCHVP
jgi:parallel beta-helix repeat protein